MPEEYKYRLRIKAHFEAAHHLAWHPKCHPVHGHTYHVELVIGSNELDENGIVIDLGIAREILEGNLPDHQDLNDWIDNPTVEIIADVILTRVRHTFVARGYGHHQPFPVELTIWETPTGGATVT